jgi:hypothetical protein
MVQELHLENKRLGHKLAESKLEIVELHDDFHTLRRGLSAKMKRLFKAVGKEEVSITQPHHEPSLSLGFRGLV